MSRIPADEARIRPLVGVLLPVYSGTDAGHFREAVLSLRAQEGVAMRIYFGLDGVLSQAHERVVDELVEESDIVLRADRQSGIAQTLNRAIEAALGDPSIQFFARMDADDISVPQRLRRQSLFLDTNPEISVVGSWCVEFRKPGVAAFLKKLPTSKPEVLKKMVYRSALAHPSVMFHRRVFEAGFRYDTSYEGVEDYELWSRLLLSDVGVSNLPEYLLWFRISPGLYERRSGWRRGAAEISLRFHYARSAGLLRPWHLIGFAALFLVRVLPVPLKKMAYRMRA